jgi:hypothetical protein
LAPLRKRLSRISRKPVARRSLAPETGGAPPAAKAGDTHASIPNNNTVTAR